MKQNEREETREGLKFEITNLDEAESDASSAADLPEKPVFSQANIKGR